MNSEAWRAITGYNNKYFISSTGRVINNQTGRILKQQNHYGYRRVTLITDNKETNNLRVHRLVAEAYVTNPEGKDCVSHINGDRADNVVSNLRWITTQEAQQNVEGRALPLNIYFSNNRYLVQITRQAVKYHRCFVTLQEALIFKAVTLQTLEGQGWG
jgi:hypothetical protein